jgi:serine/threonine-protein kinase PpkA
MSPEQAKGLARIDGRSDLYSIGVLLYEMLCGEQPYQADDQMGMMLQHVNDPIPQLPESERHYQPLITGLMAKEPDDRYQDHKAVLADMDALLLLLEQPADQEKKPVWKSLAVTGLAALLLALAAGFAWLQFDSSAPDTDNSSVQNESAVQNELSYYKLNRGDDSDESSASTQSTDSPKIARMLELAKVHEEFNELVAPPGSNALELYEAILREDPSHEFAALRIEAIKQLTGN